MFAPVSPRHNESRECIEAAGERAGDDIEVEQTRKSPWREGSIPVAREEKRREKRGLSGKMLPFHSRKEPQR